MEAEERARNIGATLRKQLKLCGLNPVAEALGVDKSTVSRMQTEQFDNFAKLLTALGLKAVPAEYECHDPLHIHWLQSVAEQKLAEDRRTRQEEMRERLSADDLDWSNF